MYQKERILLAELCKKLYDRYLVAAGDGNISMRLEDKNIIITPSRKNKGMLEPEDMMITDIKGNILEGSKKVSSEFFMHQAIYMGRPDINAVIHTHPVYATAFALAGKNIPDNYLIEAKIILGPTALAEYAAPGTKELAEAIKPYLRDGNIILLKNHGAVTYGADLMEAYDKMEALESVAKTIILSKLIGNPVKIKDESLSKL